MVSIRRRIIGQRQRRWLITVGLLLVGMFTCIACLAVIGPLGWLVLPGVNADMRSHAELVGSIEKSIRATFPTFCADTQAKLIIEPYDPHPLLFGNTPLWNVSCNPSPTPWTGEIFVTVNTLTCKVDQPLGVIDADWSGIYGNLLGTTSKLALCP